MGIQSTENSFVPISILLQCKLKRLVEAKRLGLENLRILQEYVECMQRSFPTIPQSGKGLVTSNTIVDDGFASDAVSEDQNEADGNDANEQSNASIDGSSSATTSLGKRKRSEKAMRKIISWEDQQYMLVGDIVKLTGHNDPPKVIPVYMMETGNSDPLLLLGIDHMDELRKQRKVISGGYFQKLKNGSEKRVVRLYHIDFVDYLLDRKNDFGTVKRKKRKLRT